MLISVSMSISVRVADDDPDPQATAQAVIESALLSADERIRLVEADRSDVLLAR